MTRHAERGFSYEDVLIRKCPSACMVRVESSRSAATRPSFQGRRPTRPCWVKLSALVPWAEFERCYRDSFVGSGMGAPAKSGRIAYGALLIK